MQSESDLFRTLSDPTRLQLMILLKLHGECCVCHLAWALDAPIFRVSRHLGVMKDRGLVEARRTGTWILYRLCDPRNSLESCLHNCFSSCFTENETIRQGMERLSQALSCGKPDSRKK